jgi:hypothetical protein
MHLNVGKEVALLQRMTVKELRDRYSEVFGEETRAGNKLWLVKRAVKTGDRRAYSEIIGQWRPFSVDAVREASIRFRVVWPFGGPRPCRHKADRARHSDVGHPVRPRLVVHGQVCTCLADKPPANR